MGMMFKSSGDGFEIQIKVVWARLRQFLSGLIVTMWSGYALLSALKASGLDLIALIAKLGR